MVKLIRHRSIVSITIAVLVLVGAVAAAAPAVLPHLTGLLASGSTTASRSGQSAVSNAPVSQPAAAIQTPQAAGGSASVQLAAHHVTPQSHLNVTASGFMGGE